MFCDLHTHSTASDGTTPPADLARLAHDAGLAALALTDHDTTAGLPECAAACQRLGIAFVPGIELSATPLPPATPSIDPNARRGTLHILGYFIQHDHPRLLDIQQRLLEAREQRNPQIIDNLNRLGVRIDYDEVLDLVRREAGESSARQIIGRPHIAQVLVNKGYAKSVQDAFARYIGEGKPAYARKDRLPALDAIAAIHHAGGLAVLAHPVQLRCPSPDDLEYLVKQLADMGLDGIETRHSDHTPENTDHYDKLARRFKLLATGGSDFHGTRKHIALGSQRVPLSVYETLRDAPRPAPSASPAPASPRMSPH